MRDELLSEAGARRDANAPRRAAALPSGPSASRLLSSLRWRVVFANVPFVVGGLVVALLVVIVALGPSLASQNPYYAAEPSIHTADGELLMAPFPPMPGYPLGSDRWGRDILSLLLYGARNTLIACVFVAMVRVLVGLVLGTLAGWRAGGLVDRAVMGVVGIIASLPMLLTGMVLILALDIRRGLIAFLVALCLVGWGEVAQTVRGEYIALRERAFVEGARVVGVRDSGIVWRHIFPNVLPSLVVVALMEMGGVLMLLGELAFVGIFIGGGSRTTGFDDRAALFSDVPEWGALLADTRGFVRSHPWMVLSPSAAFFVAVLGFNLLGEGLRRITRDAGINTAALVSKRLIAVAVAVAVGTWYVVEHIGPGVSYARLALGFDAGAALEEARAVAALQEADPGFGTAGAHRAAEHLAARLKAYGVIPAARGNAFLQPVTRTVAPRLSTPELVALGQGGEVLVRLQHGRDFGEQVYDHGGSGVAEGEIVFVGVAGGRDLTYADWSGLDLRGRVAVVLGDNRPAGFESEALLRGAGAVLVATEDAAPHTDWGAPEGHYMERPTLPILHVRPEALDRLLAAGGHDVAGLAALVADGDAAAGGPGWLAEPLGVRVRARVELSEPQERTGYNVLGILPGNDTSLDREALVVSTHYDLPEPTPDHSYLAAGDGPAGVGVVLEMLRLWEAERFRPRRTILVAFWCGGYLERSGAATYVAERTPYLSLERRGALHLGSVGVGEDALSLWGGAGDLRDLVAAGARRVGARVEAGEPPPHPYARELGPGGVEIARVGAPDPYGEPGPSAAPSEEWLEQVGNLVTYVLVTASRQVYY